MPGSDAVPGLAWGVFGGTFCLRQRAHCPYNQSEKARQGRVCATTTGSTGDARGRGARHIGGRSVGLWTDLRKVWRTMLDHYRTQVGYPKTLFTKTSEHHHIVVTDDGEVRHLKFGDSLQSGMYVANPLQSDFRYTEYFHLVWLFKRDIRTILFLGLGGGSAPKKFHADYPAVSIDVVEIDPAVVEVAERYFHFRRGPRLNVIVEDARAYLANTDKRYDLIVHDAYVSEAVPLHLITREFFRLAVQRLTPAGILAFNLISDVVGPDNTLFRAVYKCWQELFSAIYVFPVEGKRNVMLIGCLTGDPLPKDEVVRRAAQLRAEWGNVPLLELHAKHMHTAKVRTADVPFIVDEVADGTAGSGYIPVR
jgi:spermidine synthase